MTVRLCLGDPASGKRCYVRVVHGSYCPAHRLNHRSPTTYAGAHSRWRKVKRQALRPSITATPKLEGWCSSS